MLAWMSIALPVSVLLATEVRFSSEVTQALVAKELPEGVSLRNMGNRAKTGLTSQPRKPNTKARFDAIAHTANRWRYDTRA